MKFAALMLLLAGWIIVLAAIVLLETSASRAGFAVAGMAVEILGLVLLFRSHFVFPREAH